MSEGEFKKRSKSGEEVYEHIDGCWDRHCRSCYNMHDDEVPAYEKDLKECNEERWISENLLDEARKDFFAAIHVEEGTDTIRTDIDSIKLLSALRRWFGSAGK